MSQVDGLALLARAWRRTRTAIAIIMTGNPSVESSIEALRAGAWDYLPKPFAASHLQILIGRAAHAVLVARESQSLDEALEGRSTATATRWAAGQFGGVPKRGGAGPQGCDARTRPCSSRARAAPARSRSRSSSMSTAGAAAGRSWRSTARRCRRRCWSRRCSGTCRAPSRARCVTSRACWRRPTAARCSWTRSPRCPPCCRPSCCASFRTAWSGGWAALRRTRW
jgi:hypothetical protein